MDDRRPDPDSLIEIAAREARGRLKVFLGAAPGVGKTWEMLAQARRRLNDGVDVLAGVIETHGRAETIAQAAGIPVLPRRAMPYRGQTLEEFDLDAALQRRPTLLLIDELAHTNAPGSRHAKRWEDVQELVAAGLDVWATLNVQHLESLNDDVARITGVRVAETLPDHVLESADEIELIDVPPAELQARLRSGRIYRADVAGRALDGFFKEGNLAALREIALRQAAEHVDNDVRDWMRAAGVSGPWPASDRVLALIGPDAAGEAVIRHAKRLADALHAPWIALHVERAASTPRGRPSLELAAQLGAEVETRAGADLASVALEVAQARNVTHIVIGRAPARVSGWLAWVPRRRLADALLRRGAEYALHIVPSAPPARPRAGAVFRSGPRSGPWSGPWRPWAIATTLVGAVTGAGLLLGEQVPQEAMGMVFLAAVVAAATLQGVGLALFTGGLGFLAWDFFFIPPIYAVTISSTRDAVALAVFLVVAGVTGWLAGRLRAEAWAGQARIDSLRRIGAFSRKLGEPATEREVVDEIVRQARGVMDGPAVLMSGGREGEEAAEDAEPLRVQAAFPAGAGLLEAGLDEGAWAAARRCWTHGEPTGRGTATLAGRGLAVSAASDCAWPAGRAGRSRGRGYGRAAAAGVGYAGGPGRHGAGAGAPGWSGGAGGDGGGDAIAADGAAELAESRPADAVGGHPGRGRHASGGVGHVAGRHACRSAGEHRGRCGADDAVPGEHHGADSA